MHVYTKFPATDLNTDWDLHYVLFLNNVYARSREVKRAKWVLGPVRMTWITWFLASRAVWSLKGKQRSWQRKGWAEKNNRQTTTSEKVPSWNWATRWIRFISPQSWIAFIYKRFPWHCVLSVDIFLLFIVLSIFFCPLEHSAALRFVSSYCV